MSALQQPLSLCEFMIWHYARQATESLRRDSERGIEFAGKVLEGNEGRQFHNAVITKVLAQTLDVFVIDLLIRPSYGLCVVEGRMLSAVKEGAVAPTIQVFDLFRAGAALEQRSRIEIDAESAPVELGDTNSDQ